MQQWENKWGDNNKFFCDCQNDDDHNYRNQPDDDHNYRIQPDDDQN